MNINRALYCFLMYQQRTTHRNVQYIKQISLVNQNRYYSNAKKINREYTTHEINASTEKSTEAFSLIHKIKNKLSFKNTIRKSELIASSYALYETIADKIDYIEFFEEFNLPDTFYSWFIVTELHIWMLLVRCMAEGEDGRFVRNQIVKALWEDVTMRSKKLGNNNPTVTRNQIKDLSEQFQAALIAYDEGLQSDDTVLAGALWRRMYQQDEAEPQDLEMLVRYVRKHVAAFDNIMRDELFSLKPILWKAIYQK